MTAPITWLTRGWECQCGKGSTLTTPLSQTQRYEEWRDVVYQAWEHSRSHGQTVVEPVREPTIARLGEPTRELGPELRAVEYTKKGVRCPKCGHFSKRGFIIEGTFMSYTCAVKHVKEVTGENRPEELKAIGEKAGLEWPMSERSLRAAKTGKW